MDQITILIKQLKSLENKESLKGMARFGIQTENAFGISIPQLRALAKEHKKAHELSLSLWQSGYHEARILASMIDDPKKVTEQQMNEWVKDFNSWDLCDQCCSNLFKHTSIAYSKALDWAKEKEEFIRRAGFVMMACLAVGDKKADNQQFYIFFNYLLKYSDDERNFVKKAVNWALRQIGKRNKHLNLKALETCNILLKSNNSSTRWIAKDAFRELSSIAVQKRLKD